MANVQLSVLSCSIEWQLSLDIIADVQESVVLRPVERQLSLDIMNDADFMSNMAAVLRDISNPA